MVLGTSSPRITISGEVIAIETKSGWVYWFEITYRAMIAEIPVTQMLVINSVADRIFSGCWVNSRARLARWEPRRAIPLSLILSAARRAISLPEKSPSSRSSGETTAMTFRIEIFIFLSLDLIRGDFVVVRDQI